ncbi:MAG: hypothetical protein ACLFUQ_03925 [Candidatus Izemoplasmataceae bacterium]
MEQFSQWYIDSFQTLMGDLWGAIVGFFEVVYTLVFGSLLRYVSTFLSASRTFAFTDWIIALFAFIITIILFIAFYILLFQLLRRYFRFVKIEKQKQTLLFEVGSLNRRISTLVDENNARVALSNGGALKETPSKKPAHAPTRPGKKSSGRFVKLQQVDEKYKYRTYHVKMRSKPSLAELVYAFRHFSASKLGLYYDERTVSIFIAGMSASKTMILEGISGTGKTSLPYAFGKFFNHDASIISVQPSWRDRYEMVGYLNEFTKRFNETDFLRAIYEASYRNDVSFIVLDEMNLARVEYYFADFLSLLEMPSPEEWYLDLVPDQRVGDPYRLENGKLRIPQNIWFIGTANQDDSTFTITDKVYDRSASIEISKKAVPFEADDVESMSMNAEYLDQLFENAKKTHHVSKTTIKNLETLDTFITDHFEITFGNRIMKQVLNFLPTYIACGRDEIEGLDYLVARKIIRKFESLNLPFLQKELEALVGTINKLFGQHAFTESKTMLKKYMSQL